MSTLQLPSVRHGSQWRKKARALAWTCCLLWTVESPRLRHADRANENQAVKAGQVGKRLCGASLILGSATPSLESVFNGLCGKYRMLTLDTRYYSAEDAEVEIIDTASERRKRGMAGSFSLKLAERIRETIISHGGEVHFGKRVIRMLGDGEETTGVECFDGSIYKGPVILATGHSAKDIYYSLSENGYALEAKSTAAGVRVEHKQSLIDSIQYHSDSGRGAYLPPASYSFVTQVGGRGVYSFCMCPGGVIVPAASEENHQVVNGMSPHSRGGKWANSGIIVELRKEELEDQDPFAMLRFIESIERSTYNPGFAAPAQRLDDFIKDKASSSFPETSYPRPLVAVRMEEVMPSMIVSSLREGFIAFDRMTRGRFIQHDALLIAPETRTSSPVRILRDSSMRQGLGLYPAGEGAGYAGGIVSAAIDGTEAALRLGGDYGH